MSARKRDEPLVSKKEWRLFWLVALGLAAVTGGITALSTWLGRPEEPQNVLPSQSPFKAGVADTIPKTILITDFALPAPGGQWLSKTWLYSRDRGSQPWTFEEIQPFWTPVDRIPLVSLPEKNERAIEELFGRVR